jgi:hypothetical protein
MVKVSATSILNRKSEKKVREKSCEKREWKRKERKKRV